MKNEKRVLEWHSELSAGDGAIDAQTKGLLRQANEFSEARNSIYGPDMLDKFLGFLTDYSREHFPLQESLMKDIAYPSMSLHVEEHRAFIKQVSKFYKQVLIQKKPRIKDDSDYDERGLEGVLNDTRDFIIHWYDTHLTLTDKRLYAYFKFEYAKRDE